MYRALRFLTLGALLRSRFDTVHVGVLLGTTMMCLGSPDDSSSDSLLGTPFPFPAKKPSIAFPPRDEPHTADDDGESEMPQSAYELLSTDMTSSSSSSDEDASSSTGIHPNVSADVDTMPLEGCSMPASVTWIKSKNNKPASGYVASNAIDGKASTRWASRGRRKWLEMRFEGGEEGEYKVEGVAIAFYNGDRRVAFFDVALVNEAGHVVAAIDDLESSGRTGDFELFGFDEPAEGSTIILSLHGTTANAWNSIKEVSVCLVPVETPSPVPAPTPPPVNTASGVTFVGCFMDDVTRTIGEAHTTMKDLTPQACATFCQGYKYMGLQYSQECFCGDSYFTGESPAVPTDTCYMPCIGDSEATCGGPWSNSVYVVGNPAEDSEKSSEAGGSDASIPEVPRRQFTVVNNCDQMVRVGSTGGFVQAMTEEDGSCPDGSVLDSTVGACFWGLPLPEDDKSYDLESGDSLRVVLDHEAINGVRWSGNIWGSTGCDRSVGCETATCLRNTGWPDGYCPPSVGPTGPVTKAEFTLVDTGVDYYDVTLIDGVNLPLEMKPDSGSSPLQRDDDYWCSNPGGTIPMKDGLEACAWSFDPNIDGFGDMSSFLRWVRNDGSFADCEVDADCDDVEESATDGDYKCGSVFGQDALNGGQTTELFPKKCGSSLGWHSAGGICGSAGTKPLGYFPNSYPFMCDVPTGQVPGDNSSQADLYGCRGTYYSQSGFSRDADVTACGCPEWESYGINAPSSTHCESYNPFWEKLSLPWLKFLKKACPTSYSYPFDDHSSTFVCRNEDQENTHSGYNSMSYVLTFCPGDTYANLVA